MILVCSARIHIHFIFQMMSMDLEVKISKMFIAAVPILILLIVVNVHAKGLDLPQCRWKDKNYLGNSLLMLIYQTFATIMDNLP